ncbi:probable peroxisomal acyl-coenzyme A oxidase 1 isoform X1 [Cydia strobilella]|uniref:probable peroxisomal acyl-coenzyme A oxidase 1 isoform X1 n=2 Tax=Cydia strobilella TaxID=1100964 RepID=UPI003005CD47
MVVSRKVNEDLQKERDRCTFNVQELTQYLDGGEKITKYRKEMEDKVLNVKGLRDEVPEEYLSHKDRYENAVRKAVIMHQTLGNLDEHNLNEEEKARLDLRTTISSAIFKENSPLILHYSMFTKVIAGQADDEQQKYWLPKIRNMKIIGTYAQTELGHGTFIRGLETTAEYDPKTEEFVLNSPKLTAYKWWPGGLAHTANHCVVIAHTYSRGKSCGIQPFIVQIRDLDTHMPMKGVKLGEIGAKLGFNTVNNGFLGFENHRIPRNRMLMKFSQMKKDGTFVSGPSSKLVYGTMVYVRMTILCLMGNCLGQAVTIATRYAAVRRQSQPKPNEPEPQILDYVTQQHKLFVSIATSHAYYINCYRLWTIYKKVNDELATGNLENLAELHALSCCLKATTTADTSILVERCRTSCGGHGYMLSSNLPQTYANVTAAYTYEGENTVLHLQTARALMKAGTQVASGQTVSPSMAYLADRSKMTKWDNSVKGIIKGFEKVAAGKVEACLYSMQRHMNDGKSQEDAWNLTSVQLVAASEAHSRVILLSVYKSELEATAFALSGETRTVLYQLLELYAVYWALERLGDLLLYTPVTATDVQELQQRYETLLGKIRPNAVGLVDAFDFRDEVLNSALGAYDGRVYERLMEEALKSPLNAEPVNESFHKYLKPLMQGKLVPHKL